MRNDTHTKITFKHAKDSKLEWIGLLETAYRNRIFVHNCDNEPIFERYLSQKSERAWNHAPRIFECCIQAWMSLLLKHYIHFSTLHQCMNIRVIEALRKHTNFSHLLQPYLNSLDKPLSLPFFFFIPDLSPPIVETKHREPNKDRTPQKVYTLTFLAQEAMKRRWRIR